MINQQLEREIKEYALHNEVDTMTISESNFRKIKFGENIQQLNHKKEGSIAKVKVLDIEIDVFATADKNANYAIIGKYNYYYDHYESDYDFVIE